MCTRISKDADAFWFGPSERRAFGWYHAPSSPTRAMGVVLCPPLGHEMLCTHRAYKHLARRLAASGFATMRFDYHGTGDSAGSDFEGDRVASWMHTIDDAIDVLRSTGVTRVALVGMRMGATLATHVASKRSDVDALALIAPSVSGTAYLRELRMMHKLRDRGEARPLFHDQRPGDEEAIGFVFRRETIDALGTLDLRTLAAKPAMRALVIPRDDLPGTESKIVDQMRTLGTSVDLAVVSGYAATVTDDPYVAEIPDAIWDEVVSWLSSASTAEERAIATMPTTTETRTSVSNDVVESVLWYGENEKLFAVLAEPNAAPSDLAVIVPNTGANSRVGANRFTVTIARQLASRGHAVLRVDLGGIGDSPAPDDASENELFASRSIDDVRAAIDALAARGYRRFVTMGLCAGAYMSFHAGLVDERIVGVALMNPPAFEWSAGRKVERIPANRAGAFRSTHYYKHRALRVDTWKRLVRGEIDARGIVRAIGTRMRDRATSQIKRSAMLVGRGDWVMSPLAQKFVSFAKRDTRVLLIFNGAEPMLDEVDRHLGSMMPWLEKRGLELAIIDDTDHVFAPVWSQEHATSLLSRFVDRVAKTETRRSA